MFERQSKALVGVVYFSDCVFVGSTFWDSGIFRRIMFKYWISPKDRCWSSESPATLALSYVIGKGISWIYSIHV